MRFPMRDLTIPLALLQSLNVQAQIVESMSSLIALAENYDTNEDYH